MSTDKAEWNDPAWRDQHRDEIKAELAAAAANAHPVAEPDMTVAAELDGETGQTSTDDGPEPSDQQETRRYLMDAATGTIMDALSNLSDVDRLSFLKALAADCACKLEGRAK